MAALALVGDFNPSVIAHRAIPLALELACAETKCNLTWQWVATRDVRDAPRDLEKFSAVWLVPASPYENMAGALDAVRFARETRRPFLGTCGGFQPTLIEFARNVAGLAAADHAESNPSATTLVVTPLACSLVEQGGDVHFVPGSLIRTAYGRDTAHECYHCNYGFNSSHRAPLERAGLRFTAFDDAGNIRAAELPTATHPFFAVTLFQPERAALRGELPPLVRAQTFEDERDCAGVHDSGVVHLLAKKNMVSGDWGRPGMSVHPRGGAPAGEFIVPGQSPNPGPRLSAVPKWKD